MLTSSSSRQPEARLRDPRPSVINAYETGLVAPGSPHGYRQQRRGLYGAPLGEPVAISGNRSGERTEETSQNRCRSCDRPRGVHGKEEVEGSSPSKLFGGSQCSVPALPVEAVKDIELSHGTGRIGR